MTYVAGPVTSEAAVEIAGALAGLARLIVTGTVGLTTTVPGFDHLGGISLGSTPSVGLARPDFDRVDPDASDDGGWTPVFSRHDHHDSPCILLPGTANVCVTCVSDVLFTLRPTLDDAEQAGLAGLIVAVAMAAPLHPVAGINLDDLAAEIRRATH